MCEKPRQRRCWRCTCERYEPVRAGVVPVFAVQRATWFVSHYKPEAPYTRSEGRKEISCSVIRRKPQEEHLNAPGRKLEQNLTPCQGKCLPTGRLQIDSTFFDTSNAGAHESIIVPLLSCGLHVVFGMRCLSAHGSWFLLAVRCIYLRVSRRCRCSVRSASVSAAVGSSLCCHGLAIRTLLTMCERSAVTSSRS
jgi:hypothetical protein